MSVASVGFRASTLPERVASIHCESRPSTSRVKPASSRNSSANTLLATTLLKFLLKRARASAGDSTASNRVRLRMTLPALLRRSLVGFLICAVKPCLTIPTRRFAVSNFNIRGLLSAPLAAIESNW